MSSRALSSKPKFSRHMFRGRTVGVTGGASGIGRATVLSLAKLGANVVNIDLDREALRAVEKQIKAEGGSTLCVTGDIADEPFMERTVKKVVRKFGSIHGWVNNAMTTRQGPLKKHSASDLRYVLDVNVVSPWVACKLVAPHIEEAGGGAIVNLSSVMASLGADGDSAYITSKAAVEGMTRALSTELAPMNIRVNAVAPGLINTVHRKPVPGTVPAKVRKEFDTIRDRLSHSRHLQFTSLPYGGEPQYVADAVIYLLSDASAFVNGVLLRVDGGYLTDYKVHAHRDPAGRADAFKRLEELRGKYPQLP